MARRNRVKYLADHIIIGQVNSMLKKIHGRFRERVTPYCVNFVVASLQFVNRMAADEARSAG